MISAPRTFELYWEPTRGVRYVHICDCRANWAVIDLREGPPHGPIQGVKPRATSKVQARFQPCHGRRMPDWLPRRGAVVGTTCWSKGPIPNRADFRPDCFNAALLGCPAFSGLLNLRSLCGELRIQVFGADFARCPVAECGVNSSLIVEQFDVAGNVLLRFLP